MLIFRAPFLTVAAVILLFASEPHALARGSQARHDDPWNPDHIDNLPLEVRDAVAHMCRSSPRAAHYFATYLDNSHIIRLHFENFQCGEGGRFCRGDSCLHQDYIARGSKYRLIKSYYGPNSD